MNGVATFHVPATLMWVVASFQVPETLIQSFDAVAARKSHADVENAEVEKAEDEKLTACRARGRQTRRHRRR